MPLIELSEICAHRQCSMHFTKASEERHIQLSSSIFFCDFNRAAVIALEFVGCLMYSSSNYSEQRTKLDTDIKRKLPHTFLVHVSLHCNVFD